MAVRDVVQAAAGVGGEEATYVEDVFSTYLYTGNGSTQSIENGIALGDFGVGTSTDFDGTNDYLRRSSDLTGNADGKTFTFSAWVYYKDEDVSAQTYVIASDGDRFVVNIQDAGKLKLEARNSSGSAILSASTSGIVIPKNTWVNVLASVDLANSSNRYVFVGEQDITSDFSWSDYTNQDIDFTRPSWAVGGSSGGSKLWEGRLAHVYLDYTYRDLSVEANRRLFIDANGGSTAPSTLSALSPILYLPMTEDYSIGENLGTGGDFTVNGSPTIVQSGTQYEAGYGQGGLVWIKKRGSGTGDHHLYDTVRGATYQLASNLTNGTLTRATGLTAFNANGFSIGAYSEVNGINDPTASWTFRKAPKFFDVVTYTGNGVAGRTVAHDLGSVPGCIIVKQTDISNNWAVYHRGIGATKNIYLNATDGAGASNFWNSTTPTETNLTVGSSDVVNGNGNTYVAYLFAHDAGGFGDDGEQNVISCGSYVGNGSTTGPVINLGYEPQWVIVKDTGAAGYWYMLDTMRGMSLTASNELAANHPAAENAFVGGALQLEPQPTGFQIKNSGTQFNASGRTYIYIAIRRPMKTPESGTEVFAVETKGTLGAPAYNSGFPVDMLLVRNNKNTTFYTQAWDRLRSTFSDTTSTATEEPFSSSYLDYFDQNDGFDVAGGPDSNDIAWMFRRAPSFMDVVAYTGTGNASAGQNLTLSHNLQATPEMMIVKRRSPSGTSWYVYHSALGNTKFCTLDGTAGASTATAAWNDTSPTSSQFTVGSYVAVNYTGYTYIAYLFASCPGVSKVGSYTGTGADLNVDCGFSAGARFVLIKRTDSTGDWYVWDSARGIVSGNDPYLLLNSTAAEVTSTDYIDPLASGFTVTSSAPAGLNASGGSYIFLAIA